MLERVFVNVGDGVSEGDLLFQIDRRRYRIDLAQAQAGLQLAVAKRVQAEADVARAGALVERLVVSAQALEALATALDIARSEEEQARQTVEMASQLLEDTEVRAPYAGTISERLADEGTMVLAIPQTIVLVLQETAVLEARTAIPESHPLVHVGDLAKITVSSTRQVLEASVSAVSDTIDPATRTYEVRVAVDNADHRLKTGLFVRVELSARTPREVLLVPRDAVRSEGGRPEVLAVRDDMVIAVPIQTGLATEEAFEVVSGIDAGTQVVVGESRGLLAPGDRVTPSSRAAM
jgi:RND family efflux transporter MFP subunit